MANITLLEIVARSHPYLWEVLHPNVPVIGGGYRPGSVLERVALNPQPLPPGERLAFAGAELAHKVAEGAVLTQAQSQGGQAFLQEIVDDICGSTGRRPWPKGWPRPGVGGNHEPDPSPWEVAKMFAAVALVFAHYSGSLEGELQQAFRDAYAKVGERAEQELSQRGAAQ